VTSFYPLEEAAVRIGGDRVTVTDLTPPGVEPHDLELTTDDLAALAQADLVLYVGGGFQPAVEDAIGAVPGESVDVLAAVGSAGYPLLDDPDGHLAADPHVWLDPAGQAALAGVVRDALVADDPAGEEVFTQGLRAYAGQLSLLEDAYRVLDTCRQELLVTGHEAFGYLARAHGLEQVGVAGVAPEAEPGAQRLAEVAQLVDERGVTTVYAEELLPPDVVETIAAETGARVDTLATIESLGEEQRAAGEDYGSLMRRNLAALVRGQACG
jgi:zinc transport system substrate-binding protein